jgi:hypothetical protein
VPAGDTMPAPAAKTAPAHSSGPSSAAAVFAQRIHSNSMIRFGGEPGHGKGGNDSRAGDPDRDRPPGEGVTGRVQPAAGERVVVRAAHPHTDQETACLEAERCCRLPVDPCTLVGGRAGERGSEERI